MIDHLPPNASGHETLDEERRIDGLIALAGPIAERMIEPDPRFLGWQAAELRDRVRRSEVDTDVVERARRLAARALGFRHAVRCIDQMPLASTQAGSAGTADADTAARAPRFDLGIAAGAGRVLWDEPCDSWVSIPPELPRGRYVALTVKGDSMLPLLHSGDIVLVKLGPDAVRDTVVVARRPDDGYVVKRVGRVTPGQLELVSLNPDFPAPIIVDRDEGTVTGTVVLRWCGHGG
jgi:SOS-response transcriptional repressor LexA